MRLEFFEMIDRVDRFDRATATLSARARTPMNSPVFEGHFPGYPLVPGVLLIETMAQASGYLILGLNRLSKMPFLAGVDKAKLRQFVGPGADLEISASLVHDGSGYCVTKASIRNDKSTICNAELMFRTMPFPAGMEKPLGARAEAIGLTALLE